MNGVYEKVYDAYVSYSFKNEHFVTQVHNSELEHGEPSYRVCLHYADLPQTTFVAVRRPPTAGGPSSCCPNNYIVSCMSGRLSMTSRGQAVIFVLGDVNNRDLDPDLRHYKTYTKKETVKRFVMSELCQ